MTQAPAGQIDPIIEAQSANWRLDRMPVVDRLVLRLAIFELLYEPSTPPAVVIDEAPELYLKILDVGGMEIVYEL